MSLPPDIARDPLFVELHARCAPLTTAGVERLYALYQAVRHVVAHGVPGDVVECGAGEGSGAVLAAATLHALDDGSRTLWLYHAPADAPDEVRRAAAAAGYPADRVRVVEGAVEETVPGAAPERIALLRLATDRYEAARHGLEHLYPRLAPHGVLVVDGYGAQGGSRRAVDEYLAAHGEPLLLARTDGAGRIAVKPGGAPPRPRPSAAGAPAAGRAAASGGPSRADVIAERLGVTVDAIAEHWSTQRPAWVSGDIHAADARFLVREALDVETSTLVEIGTATGMTTGLLCFALDLARQAGAVPDDYRVLTYDVANRFYADPTHAVGDAAREILGDEMLARITFRHPATALDAAREAGADALDFVFIDASHSHPWPALDFLALLPALRPGATVALHDINLPVVYPEWQDWGAKWLFDGLSEFERRAPREGPVPGGPPNIGSVVVPEDRARLRAALLAIVAGHPWHAQIPPAHLAALGVAAPR